MAPLPAVLQQQLLLLSSPLITNKEDGWSWRGIAIDTYTTLYAYGWALHDKYGTTTYPTFKQLWHLKILKK